MFELIFLGTSASAPSVHRNVSSTLLLHRDLRFLIDAGEGTQRQLLASGAGFRNLRHILITHAHLDHILGLAGLISTLNSWEIEAGSLTIYAGAESLQRVRDLLLGVVLRGKRNNSIWIDFQPLKAGRFLTFPHLSVSAFPVPHRASDSWGFVFEEPSRRPFLNDRAEALAVPFGPERSRLVAGEAVTLADGRVVQPEEVLGETELGAKLVYVGDVDRLDPIRPYVQGADGLVIESTYSEQQADEVASHGHITASMAAQLASEAGVGALYLNHISRRYRGNELEAEARRLFPRTRVVDDLERVTVSKQPPRSG
ncbi:MAG: MBL fold metallo-hydrolase [Anaerolineales bacterium]|nr:MBL fold metallo-hydrolase [Anaerolineales bacterium]MCB9126757.1 MBL fold metallo-hydrolase [Ardenticatenales bacterium]